MSYHRNGSTIRNEVKDGALRENGLDHRVSDDWVGIRWDVKVKKRVGERLVPLREKRAAAKKPGSRRSIN